MSPDTATLPTATLLTATLLTAIGSAATALFTLGIAIFTARAANATMKATKGSALLDCLDKYVAIQSHRRQAIELKNLSMAEEFYRELLDLHWSEYHLWKDRVIPDEVMLSWLVIRRRNYDSDAIEFVVGSGNTVKVSYQDQWRDLKSRDYFEKNDPFVRFIDKAHKGEIVSLKDLRKAREELTRKN